MADHIATEIASAPPPPALSATSDMPVVAPPAPPPADAAADTTQTPPPPVATDSGEDDAALAGADTGEDTGEADAGGAPAPVKPPADRSLSGRLSQRTRERNEEKARADQLAGLLATAIEKLGTPAAAPKPAPSDAAPPPERPDPRPQRTQFDDPDAYDGALVEWASRQSARAVQAELDRRDAVNRQAEEKAQRERAAETHQAELRQNWTTRVAALKQDPEYADFEEVAYRDDLAISRPVADAIAVMDDGPKLLHWLANNPQEAERISALDPLRSVAALGALSERVSNARPPVSKAPAPVTPVRGANRAGAKTLDEMTMEEYAASRLPTIQAERRPSMFGNRTH